MQDLVVTHRIVICIEAARCVKAQDKCIGYAFSDSICHFFKIIGIAPIAMQQQHQLFRHLMTRPESAVFKPCVNHILIIHVQPDDNTVI